MSKFRLDKAAREGPEAVAWLVIDSRIAAICGGGRQAADRNATILLSILMTWVEKKADDTVYRTDEQLVADSCAQLTPTTVQTAKKTLVELGFVTLTRSDTYRWSSTTNYVMNVAAINEALRAAEEAGEFDRFKLTNRGGKTRPETGSNTNSGPSRQDTRTERAALPEAPKSTRPSHGFRTLGAKPESPPSEKTPPPTPQETSSEDNREDEWKDTEGTREPVKKPPPQRPRQDEFPPRTDRFARLREKVERDNAERE